MCGQNEATWPDSLQAGGFKPDQKAKEKSNVHSVISFPFIRGSFLKCLGTKILAENIVWNFLAF